MLYGENHPYGKPLTGSGISETISDITRDDVIAVHNRAINPSNLTFAVAGDIELGELVEILEDKFGDYNTFKDEMLSSAMKLQGSGWAYLSKNGTIKTTPNQSYKTDILMPIDMWEHSFMDYVPAKDAKKKYITGILKIINWETINQRLL